MSMTQKLAATAPERRAVRDFFGWLLIQRRNASPDAPEIALCEKTPLAGWIPSTATAAELLDQWQGIDRAELERERAAALASGGDCPCEREPT